MNKSVVKLVALALISAAAVSSMQAKSCKKECEVAECEAVFTNNADHTVSLKFLPGSCKGRMHSRMWKRMRNIMRAKHVCPGGQVRVTIPSDTDMTLLVRRVGPSNSAAFRYEFAAGELCGCHSIGCPDECGEYSIGN